KVHFGDNYFAEASGMGFVCFKSKSSGNTKKITLTNILHVPVFSLTLILVHRLAKANYTSIFRKQTCQVIEPLSCKIRMLGSHKNGLYHLD
ncbi:hypothetical protein K439DRAFT_1265665, partial [Ramaria rubella]